MELILFDFRALHLRHSPSYVRRPACIRAATD
ncbi:MAG: hypothetical protein JWO64_348, partial [Hyphomicrobiales bacterium]|nr:hypothetical protein [Hyphomicrobiales bacterium]